jgi:hypothetical protein
MSKKQKNNISMSLIGHVVSKKTRKKISKSHIGKHIPNEQRKKISKTLKGKIPRTSTWVLNTPTGQIQTNQLKLFCNKYNINYSSLLTRFYRQSKKPHSYKILKKINNDVFLQSSKNTFHPKTRFAG